MTRLIIPVILGILWGCGPSSKDVSISKKDSPKEASALALESQKENEAAPSADAIAFVGDFRILNVSAPMFESLDSKAKLALYNQYRQMGAQSRCDKTRAQYCRVRHILEQILLNSSGISLSIRDKIKAYLMQLWLFGDNIRPDSGERIRPRFIPGELGAATQIALKNGASIDLSSVKNAPLDANNIEQLEALLSEIRPFIFQDGAPDSDSETKTAVKSDSSEKEKANSSPADRSDSHPTPLARQDDGESAGPRLLYFEDPHFGKVLDKLNGLADYCDRKVREVGGMKSTAARQKSIPFVAAHILDIAGDRSPVFKLKSDILALGMSSHESRGAEEDDVHVLWLNVNEAFESMAGSDIAKAFSPKRSIYQNRLERRQLVSVAYHALRDLVGFGADGTENKESDWLKKRLGENDLLIRELRADLAALYMSFDSEVRATGLIPDEKTGKALLDEYLLSVSEQIGAGASPDAYPALKVRLMVLNHLIAAGVVTVKAVAPGDYRIAIPDNTALRLPIIQLLGKVRSIRFFGDGPKASQLVSELGKIPAGWTRGMQNRFNQMKISSDWMILLPMLEKRPGKSKSDAPSIHISVPKSITDRYLARAAFAAM
ncbi:MAG: hypothetical protein JXR76_26365 [Deltaproteobacteria bacterium]|nr:hypothetical protein [Deltaproteobacteria bacterium]